MISMIEYFIFIKLYSYRQHCATSWNIKIKKKKIPILRSWNEINQTRLSLNAGLKVSARALCSPHYEAALQF